MATADSSAHMLLRRVRQANGALLARRLGRVGRVETRAMRCELLWLA